jgi:hypothetical protein
MATVLWIIFGLASLVYMGVLFFTVRAALTYGHRGDLTFPVTILLVIGSLALWLTSAVTLARLTLSL